MTFGELSKKLSEGLSINEIINSDLNLIGNDDDTESVEDVKVDGTTDNFVSSVRQKGSRDRTNALYAIDLTNTVIEEDQTLGQDTLDQHYPVIGRNLDVLIDSLHRRDTTPEVYEMVIKKLFDNINWNNMNPSLHQFLIDKIKL